MATTTKAIQTDWLTPGTTAVAIIPPRMGRRALTDIESAMHALVSAVGRPVALELVGTAVARHFVVRATITTDLKQVVAQLRARYPQAEFCPLMQPMIRCTSSLARPSR